jgi:hypothetical protein
MKDRWLGKADRIRESEKLRRLQDIMDRSIAHLNSEHDGSLEAIVEWFKKQKEFILEEQELDRRYPGLP